MFARYSSSVTRQVARPGMAARSLSTAVAAQASSSSRLAALGAAVVGVAAATQFAPAPVVEAAAPERSFIMIKPDGVQRGLVGEIIKRFEAKGYKLVAMKMITVSKPFAESHYSDLKKKPFFNGLTTFLSSGPVVAMVWEGQDVVRQGRKLIGATNPLESEPGTIRGDNCIAIGRNIIHGSDSADSAAAEIKLWFKPEEISNWENNPWINEPGRK